MVTKLQLDPTGQEFIVSAISDTFSNLDTGGVASSFSTFITNTLLAAPDLLTGVIGSVCDTAL